MSHADAPTLADVAAHAGVSLATASRALHPSNRVVGERLKERVLESANILGYSVNAQAQAVARGSNNTVALVVGELSDPYFSGIAAGVIQRAAEYGLVVTITSLPFDEGEGHRIRELETLKALRAQRPRAVVFAASRGVDANWEPFASVERLVTIGPDVPRGSSVSIDNRGGASELGRALAGLGYTDVAVIAGPARQYVVGERVRGFTSAFPEAVVTHDTLTRDGGYLATERLIATGQHPQCIFAVADIMAIGAIAAIADAGLRPGIDIAVAGFDDIPLLRDLTPRLTTVSFPLGEIGSRAVDLALSDFGGAPGGPAIRGEIRLRASTPSR